MTELSTVPPTTQMSNDLQDTGVVDTTLNSAAQATRDHWRNVAGGKTAVDTHVAEATVRGKSPNAVATTQPDTTDKNESRKPGDTLTDVRRSDFDKDVASTTPIIAIENDQPETSRYTLGSFLGGIYTAVKDTINWAYEHPAESAAIVAGVGAAAAAAYKAYQTEYDWYRAYTKPEVTDTAELSSDGGATDENTRDIWGKAKGLWNGGLSDAWKTGWNDGPASDAGGTGVAGG